MSLQLQLPNELLIALDSIYCLHRIGDHQAAANLSEESLKQFEKNKNLIALAKLVHHIGSYEQNKLAATDYAELSNALKTPIEESKISLYTGWLHFLLGYYLKNEVELKTAATHFLNGHHLTELYETYYWMDRFKFLPRDEKVNTFLRLYPVKSIFSKMMGNNYLKDDVKANTLIEKNQEKLWGTDDENDFDCWFISENSLAPSQYNSLDIGEENCLDIYSGLINDRGEYTFLLLSELNCLSFLIASELTGVTASQMGEFLNRSEEEADHLINDIKKMGIPIKKQNDFYYLDWKDKPKIIVPRTLKVLGLQEYVRKKFPIFSKGQLIDLLQLTQYGAESLMKKWALAGFIRPVEKTSNWKFL